MNTESNQGGFSLIEVLLAASLFTIVVTSFAGSLFFGQDAARVAGERVRAVELANEALEIARNIRDETPNDPFSGLATGTHGLVTSGNQWTLSGSSDVTDIFTRELVISSVNDNIRQFTATVTWDQNAQRINETVSLTTYLTNWLSEVASVFGGWDVGASRAGCYDDGGSDDALGVAVSGSYAFVVMDGGNPDFLVIDISNANSLNLADSLNLSGDPQDVFVSGDYAYVASTGNELIVIDISTPTDVNEVGLFNLSGGDDAVAVYVYNSTAFLTRDNDDLVAIDVSTPASPNELDTLDLGSVGNDAFVLSDYVYVVTDDNNPEVQVIDVSNPSSMSVDATINLSGNSDAVSVGGFTNTLLIGRVDGELHTYDISDPTSPSESSGGSYDQGSQINDISFSGDNNYSFLATDENSAELQVVDITTLDSPSLYGSYDALDDPDYNGVAYDDSQDQVVVASTSDSAEVCVIVPYTQGDWSTLVLADTLNISGNDNGWKVAVSGDYAYMVRQSGNPDFIVIDVSDTANVSQVAALNLSNGLENIFVLGDYAYVASDSDNQELQIIDISTPTSPSQVGSYDAPGNRNAWGVYVSGSIAYLSRDGNGSVDELRLINVAVPTLPVSLGSIDLGSDANEVYVSGSYAYVATDSNGSELQVIDVSAPASPSLVGTLNFSGNANADTITGFGTNVFVGRDNGTMAIIDVTTPASPTLTATYNAGDDVNDIAIGSGNNYVLLGTDNNDSEFQVVDISTLSNPILSGFINTDPNSDVNGVAYEPVGDFAVAVAENNDAEFLVITP